MLVHPRPRRWRPRSCRAVLARVIRPAASTALAATVFFWGLPVARASDVAAAPPFFSAPFFASPPLSPAVAGMGGAAAAWVDDASALYYNSAGLTHRRFEAGFTTAVQEGNGVGDPSEQLEQFRRLFADPASA
ncbi:MAG: hypothetical protein AB1609_20140, partial [Bacillota bacterium]